MSQDEELKKAFADLTAFIRNANEKALAGKVVELGTLEKTVTALCTKVEKADAKTKKEVQPLMSEMISSLDELEQNLRTIKDSGQKKA